MFSPENIHTSNSIQTEQVIFRNTYEYPYTHSMAISKEEAMNLKVSGEGNMGEF